MVNDCAKRCQAKNVFAGKRNFSLNKAKKEEKNFFAESLDLCRRLEVSEKARNVFCDEPLRLSTTRYYTTSHLFFDVSRIFSLFSLVLHTLNFWSLRNLIKQLFHSR